MPRVLTSTWTFTRAAVPFLFLCLLLNGADDGPRLSADEIVNAADHSGGRVAPGEIVALFPSHAGPAVLEGSQLDRSGRLTTLLGSTRVFFDGIAAPMAYAAGGEVGVVVPYEVGNKTATEVVVEYEGFRSPPVTLPVVKSIPAIFTLDSSGQGQAGMLNETVCCNAPRNPAARGTIAVLYATGAGRTVPPSIDGSISAHSRILDYPVPRLPVRVLVGGVPAAVLYAAAAPHAVAGLLQVNFRIPVNAPTGDSVPLVLMVGNSRSVDGVTMAVRSAVRQILVVDPDRLTRARFRDGLAGAGYRVLTAESGVDSLAKAGKGVIDLVIFSLAIPEPERQEAMRALREERPRLLLIASAPVLTPAALKDADMLGAQTVFTKSTTAGVAIQKVRELLRSRPVPYVAAQELRPFPLNRGVPR
jgi:uncharacterized protein (TIGR03437 family)